MAGSVPLESTLWSVSLEGSYRVSPENGAAPAPIAAPGGRGEQGKSKLSARFACFPRAASSPLRKVPQQARLGNLVREHARTGRDLVILDTPPALLTVEVAELSQLIDTGTGRRPPGSGIAAQPPCPAAAGTHVAGRARRSGDDRRAGRARVLLLPGQLGFARLCGPDWPAPSLAAGPSSAARLTLVAAYLSVRAGAQISVGLLLVVALFVGTVIGFIAYPMSRSRRRWRCSSLVPALKVLVWPRSGRQGLRGGRGRRRRR